MTQQLSDARSAVQQSMSQVDAARANLQTILDNLTAGVIVLDVRGYIQSSNPGATAFCARRWLRTMASRLVKFPAWRCLPRRWGPSLPTFWAM